MPIEIPKRLTRDFVHKNTQWHFIYSSAVQAPYGHGQASVGRYLPNTSPIPVRYNLCQSSGFFNDGIKTIRTMLLKDAIDLAKYKSQGKPIIVIPGIGTGASRFKEFCPHHYEWLVKQLEKLHSEEIIFI